MEETFYNPYHFIPVAKRERAQQGHDLPVQQLVKGEAEATTHERYVKGTHSGRLLCTLTTRTPLVVGARQSRDPGQIGVVEPYMVKKPGDTELKPAIPGSSLRGLISSLAEAASNSSLRVLTGGAYSYRKQFGDSLSAIGMIVRREQESALRLLPLTLPTLSQAPRLNEDDHIQYIVPDKFCKVFPRPALKVYWGDFYSIREDSGKRTAVGGKPNATRGIRRLAYNSDGNLDAHPSLHIREGYVVAQKSDDNLQPVSGLLRVLGCWGVRTDQMPRGKTHELWLPAPSKDVKSLPIAPVAIERFHQLADERTEASDKEDLPLLPFHPLDTCRNYDAETYGRKFRLKSGDLVYFDIDEDGNVTQIALSAIWRGRVETNDGQGAGAIEFFQAVDPNLVPFREPRKQITIAERMFGFVDETKRDDEEKKAKPVLALASRIRFSDALPPGDLTADQILEEQPVPLRILSSPKPPSPALYFKNRNGTGGWIAKNRLKPGEHVPQGRKMYLHHRVDDDARPWKTGHEHEHDKHARLEQKNSVKPIRRGKTFSFHIDYENLTDEELGLLLYALAPDEKFHHKLGMGKPLGLGSVKIEIAQQQVIHRARRYSVAGLRVAREATVLQATDAGFWALRDKVRDCSLVSREIHNAICLLGNFDAAPPSMDIHTPTMGYQRDVEVDTYEWFVANDGKPFGKKNGQWQKLTSPKQYLKPLPQSRGRLPDLISSEWVPDERPQERRPQRRR